MGKNFFLIFLLILVGPVRWMSAEQMTDHVYSAASDTFAFGVVMYECFERAKPWGKLSNLQVAHKVIAGTHLELQNAPPAVRSIAERCFAHEAKDRPLMNDVAQELANCIGGAVPAKQVEERVATDSAPSTIATAELYALPSTRGTPTSSTVASYDVPKRLATPNTLVTPPPSGSDGNSSSSTYTAPPNKGSATALPAPLKKKTSSGRHSNRSSRKSSKKSSSENVLEKDASGHKSPRAHKSPRHKK